ncbi:hypothetical protein X748_28945 [Mesorhizobium sp. LNJC386A00]|nr:hypothetical protein X748_28945 [Mesorhizobium sp. LNJC386A00]
MGFAFVLLGCLAAVERAEIASPPALDHKG